MQSASVVFLAAFLVAACSGNPGGRSAGRCELSAADSVHLAGGPVYLACQVERQAVLEPGSGAFELRRPDDSA